MNGAHFIYIPVCILIGLVFGWILGGRAAQDAYLAELRRRDQRAKKNEERRTKNEELERGTKNAELATSRHSVFRSVVPGSSSSFFVLRS